MIPSATSFSFSTESHTPEAMTALASLGVLTDDEGIVEAVVAEIDELGISKTDPDGLLDYLLALIKMAKVSPLRRNIVN
jgi:hypothetical protein